MLLPNDRHPKNMSLEDLQAELEAIRHAAYVGDRDRVPERDVRFLLLVIERIKVLERERADLIHEEMCADEDWRGQIPSLAFQAVFAQELHERTDV